MYIDIFRFANYLHMLLLIFCSFSSVLFSTMCIDDFKQWNFCLAQPTRYKTVFFLSSFCILCHLNEILLEFNQLPSVCNKEKRKREKERKKIIQKRKKKIHRDLPHKTHYELTWPILWLLSNASLGDFGFGTENKKHRDSVSKAFKYLPHSYKYNGLYFCLIYHRNLIFIITHTHIRFKRLLLWPSAKYAFRSAAQFSNTHTHTGRCF